MAKKQAKAKPKSQEKKILLSSVFRSGELFIRHTFERIMRQKYDMSEHESMAYFDSALASGDIEFARIVYPDVNAYRVKEKILNSI